MDIFKEYAKLVGDEKVNELRHQGHVIGQIKKALYQKEKYLSSEELLGFFDTEEDNGDFVLDLQQAREERAEEILNKLISGDKNEK